MREKNIVLIGMPGAGKSTIGVLLAKTLGMPFVDTDLVIQQREKRLLQQIIDRDGLKTFLALEEEAVLALELKGCIVATGGSVIYSARAVEHLKKDGVLVYLELALDEIERRIRNISSRGIAMGRGQGLGELYRERVPLYEKYADVTVDCSGRHIEEIILYITRLIH